MNGRGGLALVVFVACAFALAGCSWIAQKKLDSDWDSNSQPICSDSRAFAVIDGTLASLNAVGAVAIGVSAPRSGQTVAIVSAAIDAVIFGASAVTGIGWSADCSDAREEWRQRNGGR